MKTLSKLLMMLSIAVPAFASSARADVVVRVDNYLNPSAYAYADSDDTLEVCIFTEEAWPPDPSEPEGWRCRTRVVDSISGKHDFYFTEGEYDAERVSKVRISIGR